MDNTVIERIKKLLKLSTSSNEHEAALAAERAADLMRQHNIAEAQLRIAADKPAEAEPIIERRSRWTKSEQRWRIHLAQAAAAAYDCFVFSDTVNSGGLLTFYGRESATQAAVYTTEYLIAEVDRITKAAWAKSSEKALGLPARGWMSSFRLGACVTIHERCRDERARRIADLKRTANSTENTALVVVAKDAVEVIDAWEERSRGMGSTRDRARASRPGAFEQGRAAGHNVRINGGTGLGGSRSAGSVRGMLR